MDLYLTYHNVYNKHAWHVAFNLKASQKSLSVRSAGGGQVSALSPRLKSPTYLSMRVEDLSAFGGSRQQTGRVDPRARVLVPPTLGGRSRPKILIFRLLLVILFIIALFASLR